MLLIYEILESFQFVRSCTAILDQIVRLYPNFNDQHHKKNPKRGVYDYYCVCTGTDEKMFSIKRQTDLVELLEPLHL